MLMACVDSPRSRENRGECGAQDPSEVTERLSERPGWQEAGRGLKPALGTEAWIAVWPPAARGPKPVLSFRVL